MIKEILAVIFKIVHQTITALDTFIYQYCNDTDSTMYHYDSELSNFVHCPAEFGRLAVFGWSEESRANTRWRYCLEELWYDIYKQGKHIFTCFCCRHELSGILFYEKHYVSQSPDRLCLLWEIAACYFLLVIYLQLVISR